MEKAAMEIEKAYKTDPVAMRALDRAKAIAGKKKGIQLTIFIPAGAAINFMPFTKIWEKETGTKLKFFEVVNVEVDQKLAQEAVTKSGKFDVLPTPPLSLVDLVDAKLLKDIGPYAADLNPELEGPNGVVKPLDRYTMYYRGKLWGINTDMDIFSMFLRDDQAQGPQKPGSIREKVRIRLGYTSNLQTAFRSNQVLRQSQRRLCGRFCISEAQALLDGMAPAVCQYRHLDV